MEKEESTEPKNIIDFALNDLNLLFTQDDKVIQDFINMVNKKGVNFSIRDISQLIKLDDYDQLSVLKEALAWLVHHFSHHQEQYQESLSNYKSDKKVVDKITKFLSQLDTKGLTGLNALFELSNSNFQEREALIKFRDENMLRTITDENGKIIGYFPFVRIAFEFADEKQEPYQSIANISLKRLNSLIKLLKETQKHAIESAKIHRDKLGDIVIFEEDDK